LVYPVSRPGKSDDSGDDDLDVDVDAFYSQIGSMLPKRDTNNGSSKIAAKPAAPTATFPPVRSSTSSSAASLPPLLAPRPPSKPSTQRNPFDNVKQDANDSDHAEEQADYVKSVESEFKPQRTSDVHADKNSFDLYGPPENRSEPHKSAQSEARDQVNAARLKSCENREAYLNQWEKSLHDRKQDLMRLEGTIDEFEHELDQRAGKCEDTCSEVERKEAQCAVDLKRIDGLLNEFEHKQAQLHDLLAKIKSVDDQIAAARAQLTNKRDTLKELTSTASPALTQTKPRQLAEAIQVASQPNETTNAINRSATKAMSEEQPAKASAASASVNIKSDKDGADASGSDDDADNDDAEDEDDEDDDEDDEDDDDDDDDEVEDDQDSAGDDTDEDDAERDTEDTRVQDDSEPKRIRKNEDASERSKSPQSNNPSGARRSSYEVTKDSVRLALLQTTDSSLNSGEQNQINRSASGEESGNNNDINSTLNCRDSSSDSKPPAPKATADSRQDGTPRDSEQTSDAVSTSSTKETLRSRLMKPRALRHGNASSVCVVM
jgi:hypothetical protein